MELETSKIDFKHLFKIVSIDIDKVKFKKYEISRNSSIMSNSGFELVELGKEIGEETHICKPDVIYEIAGKVGSIIKGFEVQLTGKSRKKVLIVSVTFVT